MLSVTRSGAHVRKHTPQRGFTLIELLMVISIIAILVALITPAVQSAFRTAKIGRVSAELTGLDAAANQFKARYGVNPPSFIVLDESGSNWPEQSKRVLRRIYGLEFDFSIQRDFNGDGDEDDGRITLTGDECLVFFLGGMPSRQGGNFVLTGFSHSKANPFKRGGQRRISFFNDWDVSRLSDRDDDGMPSYYDMFNLPGEGGRPYLYLSTTKNGTYDISDVGWSGMGSVYLQGSANTPWKKDGVQIISPGPDNAYGNGGRWVIDDSSSLALPDLDNITNFSGGQLEQ